MNKTMLYILIVLSLFSSCVSKKAVPLFKLPPPAPSAPVIPREYSILDYKNKSRGEAMPSWVDAWLSSGLKGVETLNSFQSRFVFVQRNEGNNFNALQLWRDNFSSELDFPRLAASRVQERFSRNVSYPDVEYGAYFEAVVRAASDAPWSGAAREDDFWLRKKYLRTEDEPEEEKWEFLILVTVEKQGFITQIGTVFNSIAPNPTLTAEQISAVDRVKDRFFEGF